MQPQFYLLVMLICPEKFVSRIVFLFLFLFKKIFFYFFSKKSCVTLKSLTASLICYKEVLMTYLFIGNKLQSGIILFSLVWSAWMDIHNWMSADRILQMLYFSSKWSDKPWLSPHYNLQLLMCSNFSCWWLNYNIVIHLTSVKWPCRNLS